MWKAFCDRFCLQKSFIQVLEFSCRHFKSFPVGGDMVFYYIWSIQIKSVFSNDNSSNSIWGCCLSGFRNVENSPPMFAQINVEIHWTIENQCQMWKVSDYFSPIWPDWKRTWVHILIDIGDPLDGVTKYENQDYSQTDFS